MRNFLRVKRCVNMSVVPKNTEEMDIALINAWEAFHRYAVGEV